MSLMNPPPASANSYTSPRRSSRNGLGGRFVDEVDAGDLGFLVDGEMECDFSGEYSPELNALTMTSIARLSDSEMNWLTRSDMMFLIQKAISATSADPFYLDVLFVVSKDDETVRKVAWLARKCARRLVGIQD